MVTILGDKTYLNDKGLTVLLTNINSGISFNR